LGSEQALIVELARWFDTPPGRYVRRWEEQQVARMVENVFGYHAVQIALPQWNLLAANRVRHKGCVHVTADWSDLGAAAANISLVADPEQLPFDAQSLDLLVLPHVLECADDPHRVLREAERVLIPEGRLIVTGFNPWSLWGARERLPGLDPLMPTPAHMQVSLARLKDWFKLLSLDLDRGRFACYAPLCQTQAWLQRWSFMEAAGDRWWPVCGAVYAVSAVKRRAAATLVGPAWQGVKQQTAPGKAAVARLATQAERP